MEEKLTVKHWDEADRPREKLTALGAEALSSAELLAILIGSGSTEESAVSLMRHVLADCGGSLRRLGRMTTEELCCYKGIGEAKAVTLLAACELGRRRAKEQGEGRPKLGNAEAIYQLMRSRLEDKPTEEFHVVLLNQNLRFMDSVCISRGGLTSTVADVRLILREALLRKAPNIAVLHNHPSGNPQPSRTDDALTEKLRNAAEIMDIHLVDHIVVGEDTYYSYNETGKL
ncbi:MAG: DNA repair protein RadC [Alloprevotella sp.]|nr:DNA repair protein RadC [Alloprevotella sp.]MBR1653174.1 DNA repair protein RadC [Alloprevotella sp.]